MEIKKQDIKRQAKEADDEVLKWLRLLSVSKASMVSKESLPPSNINKRKKHRLRKRKMLHGKQYETEIAYILSWTYDNTIQTYTKNWTCTKHKYAYK